MVDYLDILFNLLKQPIIQACLYIIGSFLAAKLADWVIIRVLSRLANKTSSNIDDRILQILHRPLYFSILFVGLGISIKNSYALNDFYNSRKPENTIMSLGVDATHSFFTQNKYLDPFKEIIVKNIKNNEVLKKFSKIISNRGLSL